MKLWYRVAKPVNKERPSTTHLLTYAERWSLLTSDELRKDFGIHAAQVVKGDTVRVMRGDEDVVDVEGKVTQVDTRSGRLVIENVTISKADGTLVARPIHASKVEITKLNLSDPMRKQTLSKKEVSQ